jgi:hypothetical protein
MRHGIFLRDQFEHSRPQCGTRACARIHGQRRFRGRERWHDGTGPCRREQLHGTALIRRFVDQPGAQVGVIIGTVERLLETPVQQIRPRMSVVPRLIRGRPASIVRVDGGFGAMTI